VPEPLFETNRGPHFKHRRVRRNRKPQLHYTSHWESFAHRSTEAAFGDDVAVPSQVTLEVIHNPERQVCAVPGRGPQQTGPPTTGTWRPIVLLAGTEASLTECPAGRLRAPPRKDWILPVLRDGVSDIGATVKPLIFAMRTTKCVCAGRDVYQVLAQAFSLIDTKSYEAFAGNAKHAVMDGHHCAQSPPETECSFYCRLSECVASNALRSRSGTSSQKGRAVRARPWSAKCLLGCFGSGDLVGGGNIHIERLDGRGGRKPLPAAHGIILAKCCENFAGGAPTAGQGAVDGAIVSGEIRGLSSKE